MTVKSKDKVKVATVRNTAFAPVAATGGSAATEAVEGECVRCVVSECVCECECVWLCVCSCGCDVM